MTFQKTTMAFLILISVSFWMACGRQHSSPPPVDLAPINDMLVTLVTRSGATKPAYVEALSANIAGSSTAFRSSINNDLVLQSFSGSLPPILSTFRAEYSAATTSTEKGTADDRLIRGILQAGASAGIQGEDLELAFLSAFADLQTKLSIPPFSTAFSDEDRELTNLFMIVSAGQVHVRVIPNERVAALATLNVDPLLSADYLSNVQIRSNVPSLSLAEVEDVIADPSFRANSSSIIAEQVNQNAEYDLLTSGQNLQSGLTGTIEDTVLQRIIDRMDAVGGVMSGMTTTILLQSGVMQSHWSEEEYFVYDWVRPEMSLSCLPSVGLADKAVQLGGTPPIPPDWSYFDNPYLAVFEIKYDFDLANMIGNLEWNQAMSTHISIPSTMGELYALRREQCDRLVSISSGLTGASEEERRAIKEIFGTRR